ncbi:GbsR/MarR family transcriptional regulator [Leeuwenhoekiella parthenopeia]|uniref:Winged helix-turn-helix domain-containing protein n=1 Tax=Leeuwenhoekiella parthenopeia TaxID=2890320 RepID=A0ABS8GRT8_9FLAO|nr:ArsR family transcriptional regulator [Leeuwenhoekiella parthenopeia]MCC4211861.1 winged helix-turn-helix domain-containing protein [Leeuwenhoekiella parthenopeia]
MPEEIEKQKEVLIERLGIFIEKKDQIPPLAARIIASLVLSGKRGCTFDDLVTGLKASKSTISTHLNSLQQSERITYFTICGDRKKYFITNPKSLLISLDEMLKSWEQEKQLHLEVMNYKEKYNALNSEEGEVFFELEFHKDFINYIDQAQNSVKKIREKVAEKLKHE